MLQIIGRGDSFEQKFIKRILHEREIEEYQGLSEEVAAQYLASRWAFKEAMVKATGNTSLIYTGMYLDKEEWKKKPVPKVEGEHNCKIIYEELEVS